MNKRKKELAIKTMIGCVGAMLSLEKDIAMIYKEHNGGSPDEFFNDRSLSVKTISVLMAMVCESVSEIDGEIAIRQIDELCEAMKGDRGLVFILGNMKDTISSIMKSGEESMGDRSIVDELRKAWSNK